MSPGTVDVFLDQTTMSGATSALDATITDWNSRLTGTGITFSRVSSSCGSGAHCIEVAPASLGTCGMASWGTPDPTTGAHTGGLLLQVHSTWSTFSADSLQRTFAHELGHFLGLHNYTSACGSNDAAMQDTFVCSPTSAPLKTATINDYLPVGNSTYGGGPTVSCAF